MVKEEFNKLNLKEQIEYINKKLENKTLTNLCEEIKISRSTIRERFLKQGYIFDKSKNKYIYSEANNEPEKKNINANNTKVLEEKIKALESKIEAINDKLNNNYNSLYEDVQKEFSKFCKENSNHKVQDILSMALYEYMEKNN